LKAFNLLSFWLDPKERSKEKVKADLVSLNCKDTLTISPKLANVTSLASLGRLSSDMGSMTFA